MKTKTEKTQKTKKRFNYRHIICIAITLGFIACGLFVFSGSLRRIIEGGRDFGLSIAYYFCKLFNSSRSITPTVNKLSAISSLSSFLPDTFDAFQSKWSAYWKLFVNSQNFIAYLSAIGGKIAVVCKIIIIVLPIILAICLLFKRYLKTQNNKYDYDSKPLRAYKWFTAKIFGKIKQWVIELCHFIKSHSGYYIIWILLWSLYFNAFTIVLEFLAYYLYFTVSFDISTLYRQVYKLFLDLWVVIDFLPLWVWAVIGIIIFDRLRKKIAYVRLHHMEMRNRGFINARPVVLMLNGTMGTGKTTTNVDMGLSQAVMFRDKAFELILENDLKFPYFPWINLENELKRAMERHSVYNLATVKRFVQSKKRKFLRNRRKCRSLRYNGLFGYNYERYGYTHNDKLKTVTVWEIIEIYAQLYFVYVIESSLILANFSVRVDDNLTDLGNFPIWDSDFFHRDSRLMDAYSRHAHILDFDSLRLGKKILQDNRNTDSFEFGVILITEVGKERGNQLENQEKKKLSEDANQKNDGFNKWLKMIRHSATIDNYPFVKVITDEQRPESLGADARDLCELVYIREKGETCLAMPFFSLGELLCGWLFRKFSELYYKYRFTRSDNTLPMYLLKAATAKMYAYYKGIYNRFGYNVLRIQVESGTQDGQRTENKYFIMHKKIYSKRFSTDCFADFFTQKALRSSVGINDLSEYETEKATFAELKQQNSYFVNDLVKSMQVDEITNKD